MQKNLYWMQCGGCGGDSMSLLNHDSPDILEALSILNIEMLWHPSMSNASPRNHRELIEKITSGEQPLDILCVEGSIIRGPGGTGMYDLFDGKPKKDLVSQMARQAQFVIAIGTCAAFGGIGADGEVESTGLQFHKSKKGGFLGENFKTKSGFPVINIPGCPCHCNTIIGSLQAMIYKVPLALNEYNAPLEWYGIMVHQGCVRNEYHEYRVEENKFGERGCLFFHLGCRGPLTSGPCNKKLWNGLNSKTRVGVPCFGCTNPDFPQSQPFFQTPNIVDIPIELPAGIDRAHYLAYKGMAAAAAPDRLKRRDTRI
ncbi:MAG: NADH:ubiquinone oxidoreductase [Candidatus Brocadiae bacterium]|nr:NADH:ubiquinone oxidoreductase [Candidatus Brocadiia bacterium]